MKKRFLIVALLLAGYPVAWSQPPSTLSILFVGNSLTYANDLPTVFKKFAAGSPLHVDVTVNSVTVGGAQFSDHWKKGDALAQLQKVHPDVLVLQGQSTEPLSNHDNFVHYASLFKAAADKVHAQTILLGTWARPAGDDYYRAPSSGGSPAEMQKLLNSAYDSLAKQLDAGLAPVGVAWLCAQREAPDIPLQDGTQHPSPAGTYLAAAVLYRTVFKTPAAESDYGAGLPRKTALSLRHVASLDEIR